MIQQLSKTAKLLCAVVLALGVLLYVLGNAVRLWIYPFEPAVPFTFGLVLAVLHSVVKVILMERTLNRAADMGEEGNAKNYGAAQVLLRNLLTVGLFLLVIFFPHQVGMYGAIAGVITLQLAGYITGYMMRKDSTES